MGNDFEDFSAWFWSECGELNKDTSYAHRLAKKAWEHKQAEVDRLKLFKNRLDRALQRANQASIGNAMFHKQFNDVIDILRGDDE